MASWGFVRGPTGARLFVEVGEEHGLAPESLLRGTGLTVEELTVPATEVEAGQELQVARNLAAGLGQPPGLGVEVGRRVSVGRLGIWAFAALSSATWGEALALFLRFISLSPAFLRPEVEEAGPAKTRIVLDDDELPADLRDLLLERDLAAIATVIPAITGAMPPARFETRLPADSASHLAGLLGSGVKLLAGRERNVVSFDTALLATPLPQADQTTHDACVRECLQILENRRARSGTGAAVRARLLEDPRQMPSMARIAAEMHEDVRTLRRRLAAEGTSYRSLRSEVCETLAVELLETAGLSVGQVADRLGYSDATAFTHAFTRWKGIPPSSYTTR